MATKPQLEAFLARYLIDEAFPINEWSTLRIRLLSGISYAGNAESNMGKGTLYATGSYGQNVEPRYDFITVLIEEEQNECDVEGCKVYLSVKAQAQIVALIEVVESDNTVSHAAVVQYLEKEATRNKSKKAGDVGGTREEYFPKYKWEIRSYGGAGRKPIFNTEIIDMKCVVGPAIVIPDFALNDWNSSGKPQVSDSFHYVRPEWIDRGGYVDNEGIDFQEGKLGKELSGGAISVGKYLRAQQTARNSIDGSFANLLKFDVEAVTVQDLGRLLDYNDHEDGTEENLEQREEPKKYGGKRYAAKNKRRSRGGEYAGNHHPDGDEEGDEDDDGFFLSDNEFVEDEMDNLDEMLDIS